MLYEGVVLFGVLMVAGYVYGGLTNQRHALSGRWGLQLFLFLVLGLYFTWFWSHSGQTVATKTWHLRLVDAQGQPVTLRRAWVRYALSWLWFLPALLWVSVAEWHGAGRVTLALLIGVAAYALTIFMAPNRQFLHDRLSGTQVIDWRPAAKAKPKPKR